MYSKPLLFLFFILVSYFNYGQKSVLQYPFEFEKSILARGNYDAYFLDNHQDSTFTLLLKDNKKTEYLLLDKKFKIVSKIATEIDKTIFGENEVEYVAGTSNGTKFHFIYREYSKKAFSKPKYNYLLETVDFTGKTISHQVIFEVLNEEKHLASFADYDSYYTITADDKASELIFYVVNSEGLLQEKRIPFKVPATAAKKRDKLSEYLSGLTIIKGSEEPDFSAAVTLAKVFSKPGQLDFVINEETHPAHIVSISLQGFTVKESFVEYREFSPTSKKAKVFINSFLKNDLLFSLILNNKSIHITVHNIQTGAMIDRTDINEETSYNIFAQFPVTEKRAGKKTDAKDIDNIKKLIQALSKGTEGIMVNENNKGQFILTVGTYDPIQLSSGGSSGEWQGGYQMSSMAVTPGITNHGATYSGVMKWNPHMYYRAGTPGYTTTSARYYTSTYFKLLTDGSGLKLVKGRVPVPVADQIKDYMETVGKKAQATNQFSIGEKQYFGYYDRELKTYVVEEIRIR